MRLMPVSFVQFRYVLTTLFVGLSVSTLCIGCIADEDHAGDLTMDCAELNCAEPQATCETDYVCADILACVSACKDEEPPSPTCVSDCQFGADEPTMGAFDAYMGCLVDNACIQATVDIPTEPEIADCIAEQCPDEAAACETAGCDAYSDCLAACDPSSGDGMACLSACNAANPDASAALVAQTMCMQENCGPE